MEEDVVRRAKAQAARRGKSVSRMFGDLVSALDEENSGRTLPPVTASLLGVMKGSHVSEEDYKRHLQEKHS